MSTAQAKERKYSYSVSDKTEARVRRIYGNGAEDVLKKLRKGQTVRKGPHTFRPEKRQILPEFQPGAPQAESDNKPAGGGTGAPPKDDKGKGSGK